MRHARIKGKDIYLSEKEYKGLLKRFNPKRFKRSDSRLYAERYENKAKCCFCDQASRINVFKWCDPCPFEILKSRGIIGCFQAIHSVLTKYELNVLYNKFILDDDVIAFEAREKTGKKILQKIYSAAKEGFKKVKPIRRKK